MTPTVLWAQRPDRLFLTIELWEATDVTLTFPDTRHLEFNAVSNGQKFELSLEFYGAIQKDQVNSLVTNRHITMVVMKEDAVGPYWPRLVKPTGKNQFIKTDFDKWIDEDELGQADEESLGGGMDFSKMMAGMGNGMPGMGGMGGFPGMGGGSDFSNLGFGEEDMPEDWQGKEEEEGDMEPLDVQIRNKQRQEAEQASEEGPQVTVTESN